MNRSVIIALLMLAPTLLVAQDLSLVDSAMAQVGMTREDIRFDQDELATFGGDLWRLSYFTMFHKNPFKLPKYGQLNLEAFTTDCGNIAALVANGGRKIDCPVRRGLVSDALEKYTKSTDSLPLSSFTQSHSFLSGSQYDKLKKKIDLIYAMVDDDEFNFKLAFDKVDRDKCRRQIFSYFVADSQKYNDLVESFATSVDLNRMVGGAEDLAEVLKRTADSLEFCAFPEVRTEIKTKLGLIVIGSKTSDVYTYMTPPLLILDPGGDDTYRISGFATAYPFTAIIDVAGNDTYISADSTSPGSSNTGGVRQGSGSFNRFTFDDVDALQRNARLIDGVSPVIRSGGQVIGGVGNWSTGVYGVSPEYFRIRSWQVKSGDFFTDKDVIARRKVALLGKTVADQLFPNQDPIGQNIRIRNIPFTVIGVLKAKGQTGMGQDQDDIILAPSTSVLYRLKGDRHIDMINASAASSSQVDSATAEIRSALRKSHKLTEGQDDDFTVRSQAEIMQAATQTTKTMTLLLGSIAAVSLLVGGIGIMNIMLVSVTERTREIGIRLSIGARESDVMIQFLTEAVVLSVSGGIIGISLSTAVVAGLNKWTTLQPIITADTVILSFLFSAAVGIFFGFYPARKAAALDPIDALRHE